MDVKILAICDTEKLYARKLMEAFSKKETSVFQIHAFSTEAELTAFAERTQIEILLIAGKMMSRSIDSLKVGKIILLSDGDICEQFSDYEMIYKYQSAEHIMKEILCCYADYARPAAGKYTENKEFAVYGVYSPTAGCGRTFLSEALAGHWGKKKKTLFLNLRMYSFLPEQRNRDDVWDLSDMIYFLRQGKKTFLYKLDSIARQRDDFDCILPMKFPEDIRSVTLGEWTELLEKLASESSYQVIVIEFGDEVNGIYELLSQCTEVYMPVLSDAVSAMKLENFEWILREKNFERLSETIHKICLPGNFDRRNVQIFMDDWVKRFVK